MINHGYRWAIALATNGMPFPPNCLIRLDNRQKEIGGEGGIRTLGEFNEINKVKTVWAILGRWRSFEWLDIESKPRLFERGLSPLAHRQEHYAVAWRAPDGSIGAYELRFAAGEQHRVSFDGMLVKPRRAGVGAHDRYPVAMFQKPL